jgi:hypothetical protein
MSWQGACSSLLDKEQGERRRVAGSFLWESELVGAFIVGACC